MIQNFEDEVLASEPKYKIKDNAGNVINDNVIIEQVADLIQEGTPLNKATFGNIQGDLYTQDRYNKPIVSYDGVNYIHKLLLPLTSYETGKIVNIEPQQLDVYRDDTTQATNIFPTTGWTEVTENTKYTSNGYTVESSTSNSSSTTPDKAFTESWNSDGTTTSEWIKVTCPQPTKITKMIAKITTYGNTGGFKKAIIQGSKDNNNWIDLHTVSAYQASETEMVLANTDYYTYYQIVITLKYKNLNVGAYVGKWQVAEWVEGAHVETVTLFENPYININNLGAKQINGTIEAGEKYSLVYNGESWDVQTNIITGTYSGISDISSRQPITLGFQPKVVIVTRHGNYGAFVKATSDNNHAYGGVAILGYNSGGLAITESGFEVANSENYELYLNLTNVNYQYIAFK